MKTKKLFFATFLLTFVIFSISFAQDNTQVGLPEGAIARLGKGGINIMRFSPDGTHLAVGTDVGLWLYDVPTAKETALFTGHTGQVNALTFSSDGSMLASGGFNSPVIQVWDPETSGKLTSLKLTQDRFSVRALTFFGRSIVAIKGSKAMIFVNPESGDILSEKSFENSYNVVAFSQDGTILAAAERNGKIHLWDTKTSSQRGTLTGHGDDRGKRIGALAFSPDGKILASGGQDNIVLLWDTQKHTKIGTLKAHTGWVTAIAFSEDGKTLASGDANKEIILWDLDTGKQRTNITTHKSTINTLAFAPVETPLYGMCLASGSADGTIRFWNPKNGEELSTFSTGHIESVEAVAFSENDTTLVSAAFNGIVDVWSLKTRSIKSTFTEGQCDLVHFATISSDGALFAKIGRKGLIAFNPYTYGFGGNFIVDGKLRLWKISTGEEITKQWEKSNSIYADAGQFSSNNNILAVSRSQAITGYHVYSGTELFHLKSKGRFMNRKPVFSPDGKWIALNEPHNITNIWNIEFPDKPAIISNKKADGIAFSPDGSTLAMMSNNGIHLWKFGIESEEEQTLIRGNFVAIENFIRFSPDGSTLLLSIMNDQSNTIQLWDAQTGRGRRVLSGHTEPVKTLMFSHDGKTLATGSQDGTILLWDWEKISANKQVR